MQPDVKCPSCGGELEPGIATAEGLLEGKWAHVPRLLFVTSPEQPGQGLIESFRAGVRGDVPQEYRLYGARCKDCTLVQFYAR
ncbi:hypothetical protein [Planctomicrobium sp. SH664]|uniref:hypothetical protein n=1 Tax=Planctomicrobium sp. SH664 TaxID=3448125 RepID=UPI003F5C715E